MFNFSQFEPLPDTSQGLSALMLDFRVKSSAKEVEYHPLAVEVAERLEEFDDMDPAAQRYCHQMKEMFGSEGLLGILSYHQLKARIHCHQIAHDISGIIIRSKTIAGQPISYPNWDEDLALLDSDIPVLKAAVPAVVEYFERLAGILTGYRLVREVRDKNDQSTWDPSTMSEVRTFSQIAGMTWIHTESWDWREDDQGQTVGHWVDKDPPDQVHIIFRLGRPDSNDSINFVLASPTAQPVM